MHADTQLTHREEHVGTGLQRLFIVGGGGGDGVGVCVTCGEETRLGISGDSHHPSVHFDTYDGVEWGYPPLVMMMVLVSAQPLAQHEPHL